eukprot:CFRG2402T1
MRGLINHTLSSDTEGVGWVLGRPYNLPLEYKDLVHDVRSRVWFSYRTGYFPIRDHKGNCYTTDQGWGCMLRCGQMILAQTFIERDLGRDWRWGGPNVVHSRDSDTRRYEDEKYHQIITCFSDAPTSPFSIHSIAHEGVSLEKNIGQWFGPTTVSQALRRLCEHTRALATERDETAFAQTSNNSSTVPLREDGVAIGGSDSLTIATYVAMDSVVGKQEMSSAVEKFVRRRRAVVGHSNDNKSVGADVTTDLNTGVRIAACESESLSMGKKKSGDGIEDDDVKPSMDATDSWEGLNVSGCKFSGIVDDTEDVCEDDEYVIAECVDVVETDQNVSVTGGDASVDGDYDIITMNKDKATASLNTKEAHKDLTTSSEREDTYELVGAVNGATDFNGSENPKMPVEEDEYQLELDSTPLLLMIPLRLGLDSINECYINQLKKVLMMPCSVGVIGGRPNSAYFFIGWKGNDVIFMDPHITQPVVSPDSDGHVNTESYHCHQVNILPFTSMDPSLCLGFLLRTKAERNHFFEVFEFAQRVEHSSLFNVMDTVDPFTRIPGTCDLLSGATTSCDDSEDYEVI